MNTLHSKSIVVFCVLVILSTIVATAPPAQAAPPKVVCVPWYPANLAVSHDTWTGEMITLKGTAHDPDGDGDLATYEWDFGDGSPADIGVVSDPYIIETAHAYAGSVGDIFVATLTVTDTGGESGSDNYLVTIRDGSVLSVQVNVAIDEGLWRLHKDLIRATYADGTDYGSLSYGGNSAAATGAGIEAFEIHGHLPTGNVKEDPYVETVQRGLNYLLANTNVHPIGLQTAGDPDTNGNGIGLGCYTDSGRTMYECGITLMTFASSKAPGMIAATGPVNVVGRSYGDIVQDMVDYVTFGQSDPSTGVYRGGWRYYANYGHSDNSCSQWPVIGMEAAETNFGTTIPGFVKSELTLWINYIQNDTSGGSGYTDPWDWVNVAKTGGLLCEMSFFGDGPGAVRADAAWQYIGANWDTDYEHFPGNSYYAFYSVMKGFRLMGIYNLPDGTNWYSDPARGYATYLVNTQSGGSWSGGYWSSHPMSTAWALLTLQETVVEPGPVADAGPDVAAHPPVIDVEFDGSGSYHLDSAKEIVLYEWDFEGDGVYDFSSSEPTAAHAYPAVYNPDGTIDWLATEADYTVVLRVTDNSSSPKTDTDECIVHITPPPWPPVADPGGPYLAAKCETITLDGSASYAPGGQFYEPDHPWYAELVSWEWDLDNDGAFDDATGETVEWMSCVKGLYVVGLKVTDDLDTTDSQDTVINVANRPPEAEAGGPYSCALGEITFDGSGSTDPDEGETETLEYRWDFDTDGIYDTAWSPDPTATHTYDVCEDHTATLEVRDTDGATDTDTADVVPNRPPDCSGAYPDPLFLWPPNHKMVSITILGVTDPDGDPVTITVTGITSDEATASDKGSGGAKHAPDAEGVGTDTPSVRAESSGTGNGRVYEISFDAEDDMGGACSGAVKVYVPHDQGTGDAPVDDGQIYDATEMN